jgi:hypothetical protein
MIASAIRKVAGVKEAIAYRILQQNANLGRGLDMADGADG